LPCDRCLKSRKTSQNKTLILTQFLRQRQLAISLAQPITALPSQFFSFETQAHADTRNAHRTHTAATRMPDSGTTVSATAKWLGHDPAMTLRVYGHVYDDALASAGDVLFGVTSPANAER
jgi:integrase